MVLFEAKRAPMMRLQDKNDYEKELDDSDPAAQAQIPDAWVLHDTQPNI